MRTLTRGDVARRLRKSIATVRRLENRVLFPVRDERGVRWFDEAEVERVRRDPGCFRKYARSNWFEIHVRARARRPKGASSGSRRRSNPTQPEIPVPDYGQLAHDLQASFAPLLLRLASKRRRT
jgi:hypothetical protein